MFILYTLYNSNIMDSTVWGPAAWTFLHSITMTYPERPGELEKTIL